jgi:hypothetical protein
LDNSERFRHTQKIDSSEIYLALFNLFLQQIVVDSFDSLHERLQGGKRETSSDLTYACHLVGNTWTVRNRLGRRRGEEGRKERRGRKKGGREGMSEGQRRTRREDGGWRQMTADGEQMESRWRADGEQMESRWRADGEQMESRWRAMEGGQREGRGRNEGKTHTGVNNRVN